MERSHKSKGSKSQSPHSKQGTSPDGGKSVTKTTQSQLKRRTPGRLGSLKDPLEKPLRGIGLSERTRAGRRLSFESASPASQGKESARMSVCETDGTRRSKKHKANMRKEEILGVGRGGECVLADEGDSVDDRGGLGKAGECNWDQGSWEKKSKLWAEGGDDGYVSIRSISKSLEGVLRDMSLDCGQSGDEYLKSEWECSVSVPEHEKSSTPCRDEDSNMNEGNVVDDPVKDDFQGRPTRPVAMALKCDICSDVLKDAHSCLECLHSYCYACIMKHITIGNPTNACPVKGCGTLEIDGFKPTLLGKDPFDSRRPKIIFDGALNDIVKKIFPRPGLDAALDFERKCREDDIRKEHQGDTEKRTARTGKPQEVNMKPCPGERTVGQDTKPHVNLEVGDLVYANAPSETPRNALPDRKEPASVTKSGTKRKTSKPAGTAEKRRSPRSGPVDQRNSNDKRLLNFESIPPPAKKRNSPSKGAFLHVAVFPKDILLEERWLPCLDSCYFAVPEVLPVGELLEFVEKQLRTDGLELSCQGQCLMDRMDCPLKLIFDEIWLPNDTSEDVFTLFYTRERGND